MFSHATVFSSYSVNDIDAALHFYADILGLSTKKTKEGLSMTLKNGQSVFLYQKNDHQPATFTVLNFIVEDIDGAASWLAAQDIKLEQYDIGEMQADVKGIYRGKVSDRGPDIVWFKDPAGNILSVIEE